MSAMKKIAAELLKDLKQIAGLAGAPIYELSDKIGIAILPAGPFNPDGTAIVVLNDGRAWWAAGDRREELVDMLPTFDGASFTREPELLEELVARTKIAILKAEGFYIEDMGKEHGKEWEGQCRWMHHTNNELFQDDDPSDTEVEAWASCWELRQDMIKNPEAYAA